MLAEGEWLREHPDEDLDKATAELPPAIHAQQMEAITGASEPAEASRYLLSRLVGREIHDALLSEQPCEFFRLIPAAPRCL